MKLSKTEARWRRLISEQERSGQSIREFAEEKGVSAWSLYGWRSRLGVAGRRKGSRCSSGRGGATGELQLVAVDVVDEELAPVVGAEGLLEFEIVDVRVRVPRGFDAEELGRLLSVLRASC